MTTKLKGNLMMLRSGYWSSLLFLILSIGNHALACEDNESLFYHGVNNQNGCIYYQDSKFKAIINCQTNACNIQQVSINDDTSYIPTLEGTGYWWGASPPTEPDGGDGWAQVSFNNDPQLNANHVNYNIQYHPWGIKISWAQDIHSYHSHQDVGLSSWGSYELPYETGFIRVWHRFVIDDIQKHQAMYNSKQLGSFGTNLDINTHFDEILWPSRIGSIEYAPVEDYKLHSFSIIGGDWNQPAMSGPDCSTPYPNENQPYFGQFHRKMQDARCHDRINHTQRINMAWGTSIEATQHNDPDATPYMMHYDEEHQLGVVRVISSNADRRKTIQVFDNGGFFEPGLIYSSGISWDWGDMNYDLWWPAQFTTPELNNGYVLDTHEELWFGVGSTAAIKNWVNFTHNIK